MMLVVQPCARRNNPSVYRLLYGKQQALGSSFRALESIYGQADRIYSKGPLHLVAVLRWSCLRPHGGVAPLRTGGSTQALEGAHMSHHTAKPKKDAFKLSFEYEANQRVSVAKT